MTGAGTRQSTKKIPTGMSKFTYIFKMGREGGLNHWLGKVQQAKGAAFAVPRPRKSGDYVFISSDRGPKRTAQAAASYNFLNAKVADANRGNNVPARLRVGSSRTGTRGDRRMDSVSCPGSRPTINTSRRLGTFVAWCGFYAHPQLHPTFGYGPQGSGLCVLPVATHDHHPGGEAR